MNDGSDKFMNPTFKGDILNVLTRQHNKPVGKKQKDEKHLMHNA